MDSVVGVHLCHNAAKNLLDFEQKFVILGTSKAADGLLPPTRLYSKRAHSFNSQALVCEIFEGNRMCYRIKIISFAFMTCFCVLLLLKKLTRTCCCQPIEFA